MLFKIIVLCVVNLSDFKILKKEKTKPNKKKINLFNFAMWFQSLLLSECLCLSLPQGTWERALSNC